MVEGEESDELPHPVRSERKETKSSLTKCLSRWRGDYSKRNGPVPRGRKRRHDEKRKGEVFFGIKSRGGRSHSQIQPGDVSRRRRKLVPIPGRGEETTNHKGGRAFAEKTGQRPRYYRRRHCRTRRLRKTDRNVTIKESG